jgi:small-conductance mechanosensitive channel
LDELIAQVQELSEFIGPNVWLQAVIIAAAFILAGKIADWVISRIIGQFAKRSDNEFDDRLVKLVHHPVFMSFVLAGLVLATQHLDMPAAATFITVNLLKTIAIVIWFRALGQLNNLIVETLRKSRGALAKSGMLPLVHNVMKVVLVALAIYFFFIAWRIDVTAWLASAGIVGLALSFAARDTLSNLFAGVSIIMDAPYKSGDYIILDSGERGVVTEIGLRSTRILTRDDIEITVPNSVMGNSTITNEAGGPPSRHRIRVAVGVAYGSDVDHVLETLENVAVENELILAIPSPRARFRNFGDSSLDFELMGWIADPATRGLAKHQLNCAVYKKFNAEGIEIPFPQRDLHVRTMPAGES